jgi:hypothetical protein
MFQWLRENRELKKLHAQPISPIVQRIIRIFENSAASDWTTESVKDTYCDLSIHGPSDINITVWSYHHEWYHVYVNGDEVTLSKRDELEIAKLVDSYRQYANQLDSWGRSREVQERDRRILQHLELATCD